MGSSFGVHQSWSFCQSSPDVTRAGQAMVAFITDNILLSSLIVCSNKAARLVNLTMPHIREEKGGACLQPPQTVHPDVPQVGGREGGETDGPDSSPSFPVPPDPGKGQELCRRGGGGDSAAAGDSRSA